jgi:hypothetical protein
MLGTDEINDWHRMAAMLFDSLLVLGAIYIVGAIVVFVRNLVLASRRSRRTTTMEESAGACPRCKSERTATLFSSMEDEDEAESKVPSMRQYCVCWICHFKWHTRTTDTSSKETPQPPRGAA